MLSTGIVIAILLLLSAVGIAWWRVGHSKPAALAQTPPPTRNATPVSLEEGRKSFSLRREWLEAEFLTKARNSGRPRGLDWANCEFDDDVTFAREKATGYLRGLVSVTIQFEAIEGGGMEDVEAVSRLRSATAVFHLNGTEWRTDGRAVFNLDPLETIHHFQHELEAIA